MKLLKLTPGIYTGKIKTYNTRTSNKTGFVENSETNRLIKRKLKKEEATIEIRSCGGIMNIPNELKELQEQIAFSVRKNEVFDKVFVLIDHDTVSSNVEFMDKVNEKLETKFSEVDINVERKWKISNEIMGEQVIDIFIKCLPESETGAIEKIMLEALSTDNLEQEIIDKSNEFIIKMAQTQKRYLQRKSLISKAVFNTYFAIRTPEEKYDERARILKAYDWKNNETINKCFSFLDI